MDALPPGPRPTNRRLASADGPDFYPTPAWATHALMDNEAFRGMIWEPACGDGSMAAVLEGTGNMVFASDLNDHGYGSPGRDFLTEPGGYPNIVTNPPYNLAEAFAAKGLEAAGHKLCLLLRLAFLEGARRASTLFLHSPPSRVWVFSERITFYRKGAVAAGSGTTAYAWFVWDREHRGGTELRWLKPGYKARHGGRAPRS